MVPQPNSSRRDFLSGKAVQQQIRYAGDEIANALVDAATGLTVPVAGETVRLETKAMGCTWCVIMNPGPPRQVMVASDAFDVVRDVEELLTIYSEASTVSRLNREAFLHWQPIGDELFQFLEFSLHLHRETQAAFDPAIGALIQLWKAGRQQGRIPFEGELERARDCSGMEHLSLDPTTQSVKYNREGLLLDFASIGKGYGIDRAANHIAQEGVEHYLVHGGQSSLFAAGVHHGLDGWPIGLKNPLFTEKRYATILLKDCGMATSGSNVQFFRFEGKRYGHLLDPRTGWPAQGLLSVTVLAPTATEADALSTAFYAMGLDKAKQYCDDHPQIGAILVPSPVQGRVLEPVVRNIPQDRLFFEEDVAVVLG